MRWFLRVSLLLTLFGLVMLTIWPHRATIQEEAVHLYQAWQHVRTKSELPISSASEAKTETSSKAARRSPSNPQAAIDPPIALDTADPFLAAVRRRAEEDPEATMQWLQARSTGSERLRGMLEVVALWAAKDSESTLLWLESNAQGLARLETLHNGIELWAKTDPAAAADWIEGMANDGSKLAAAKSLAAQWVESDPDAAATWVSQLPNDPARQEATRALAEVWMQRDPAAASVWAFQEAEFNGNFELLYTTIREFSIQSPGDAETFVRDMANADYAPLALAAHVVGRAEQDPVATAKWLVTLSPSDPIYSTEYANSLMQVWAESDSIAASKWLSEQPQGPLRDAAAYGFSESIQRFEPEAAAAWANTIRDPSRRLERLEASFQDWAETRPVEAMDWLKRTELEPSLREQLARKIPVD